VHQSPARRIPAVTGDRLW